MRFVWEGARPLSTLPSSIWCYSVTPAPKFLDQPLNMHALELEAAMVVVNLGVAVMRQRY